MIFFSNKVKPRYWFLQKNSEMPSKKLSKPSLSRKNSVDQLELFCKPRKRKYKSRTLEGICSAILDSIVDFASSHV